MAGFRLVASLLTNIAAETRPRLTWTHDMTGSASRAELDHLSGLVERVTFHNGDSGFCVLRLKVKGERELVTLIGQ